MGEELRVLTRDELGEAFALDRQAFNSPREVRDRWIEHADPARLHGVFLDGRLVSLTQVHPFAQFFGGRSVPMGGLAAVSTAPEHRGRGLARRVVAASLEAMRERGEVLSALYPATTRLYRELGWEVAGSFDRWRIYTTELLGLPAAPEKRVRRAGPEDLEQLKQCYARFARNVNGLLDRPDVLWSWRPHWTEGLYAYASCGEDGEVDGYVVYTQKTRSGGEAEGFAIDVQDAVAENEAALRALWRTVASSATVAPHVTFPGSHRDPLLLLLPEQHRQPARHLVWMLRLVDAQGAIRERGFPPGLEARVELEIADAACAWNAGRFVLEVAEGRGRLEKGGRGAVRLGAGALASLYSGWSATHALRATGLLAGGAPRDHAALDAAFGGPAPYLLDQF